MEQLEVLLLLRDDPDRRWTVDGIARELRATASAVELRLQDLKERGLAAATGDSFHYRASAADDTLIEELEGIYRMSKVAVIQLIFSGPSPSVRSFADAFRVRGEEDK